MNALDKRLEKTGYRTLLAAAVQRYDPVFAELVAYLGFDLLWIETEHEAMTLDQAGDLVRIASGVGLLTMIRINTGDRDTVLKAAELGPDILDLPMANSVDIATEFVRNARYPPQGVRGFYGSSRAMRYGVGLPPKEQQQKINEDLCLLIQVETKEAVEIADDLCKVPGVDGIFIGPGDLSASYGVTGDLGHPTVKEAMLRTVRTAKKHGKRLSTTCAPGDFAFWAEQGVDFLVCTGNISCVAEGVKAVVEKVGDARRRP